MNGGKRIINESICQHTHKDKINRETILGRNKSYNEFSKSKKSQVI